MKDVDVTQEAFKVVKRDALDNMRTEGSGFKDIFQNIDFSKNANVLLKDLESCKNLAEEIEIVLKKANSIEEVITNSSYVGFIRGISFGLTITKKTDFISRLFKSH